MKAVLVAIVLVSNAFGATSLKCKGTSIYPDPRISISSIELDFPQNEKYVAHNDMSLSVKDFFTESSAYPMEWTEHNKDFFSYTISENQLDFSWGKQHYGELFKSEDGSYMGKITISKNYDFEVICEKAPR